MGTSPSPSLGRVSDRSFYVAASLISTGALALIAYTLLIRGGSPEGSVDLRFMPAVNACLNAVSATLLTVGFLAIRTGAPGTSQVCARQKKAQGTAAQAPPPRRIGAFRLLAPD